MLQSSVSDFLKSVCVHRANTYAMYKDTVRWISYRVQFPILGAQFSVNHLSSRISLLVAVLMLGSLLSWSGLNNSQASYMFIFNLNNNSTEVGFKLLGFITRKL